MASLAATHQYVLSKTIAATSTYTLSANGRVSLATLEAGTYIPMGALATNAANEGGLRYRGVEIELASSAADNATGSMRVYLFTPSSADRETGARPTDGTAILLGTCAYTVGSGTGIASSTTVTNSYRMIDTMAWTAATTATTPKGISTQVDAVYGANVSAQAYSPADNTVARLFIPDTGNCDVFLDFSDTAAVVVKSLVRVVV